MRAEQQPLLVPAAFVLEPRPDPRLQWMRILLIIQSAMLFMLISSAALLTLRGSKEEGKWPDVEECEAFLQSDVDMPFSLILTADPGDFSGTPEAHFIIANLRHRKVRPRDSTVCGGVYQGMLMGQPVLVVTTGIGPPAAGLCTLELVTACGPWIKEILYFGTSGWSPQLGGVLNPPDCGKANGNGNITRLGDVCISPFSVNWTCKKATWSMQAQGYPNQCFRPGEVSSPNATALYGNCQFYEDNMSANLDLADDLMDAIARTGPWPTRTPAVTEVEQRYWWAMGNATRAQYPEPEASSAPHVWDYTQCMEVDGQFFFNGVPWELKARDYAAETLTAALQSGYGSGVASQRFQGAVRSAMQAQARGSMDGKARLTKSARDMIAVSAMEGIGVGEALLKYHALSSTIRKIPYTHVRTLSNWLHQPVKQVSTGHWEVAEELPEDFVTGYGFAIATGSSAIMSLYQVRCQQDVARGRLPHSTDCSFSIDYGSWALQQQQHQQRQRQQR